jgi:hypothetical protein
MIPQKPLDEKQNPGGKRALDKKVQEAFNKYESKHRSNCFSSSPCLCIPATGKPSDCSRLF